MTTKDDGGRAFSHPWEDFGGPAFPAVAGSVGFRGMTLRDWFAGQALAGLDATVNPHLPNDRASTLNSPEADYLAQRRARWSYLQADAMLAARK
jgi:hypothetical protein